MIMKKRRIIFRVFPFNRLTFPLLLNVWESEGIDENFEIVITEDQPECRTDDIVLYSFMTPHLPLIHEEIGTIKKQGAFIAAGGPHLSGNTELADLLGIDILFTGDGEESFKQFGYDLISDNQPSFRKIYCTEARTDPDRYFPFSKYFKTVPPLQIFRGCIWRCKYCQTGSNGYSFRSIGSINSFLERLKGEGFNRVTFISPSAMEYGSKKPGYPDIDSISDLIETVSEYNFSFFEYGIFPSEIRPGTLNPELADILRKNVNNNSITLGAQSGSDIRLKELNRGHTTEDVIADIQTANSAGFSVNLDFIMGFPDETRDEREETFRFIRSLSKKYRVKIHLHHFFPLSGSKYEFRLPTYLDPKSKLQLLKLTESGISTDWWKTHESGVKRYFFWLKNNFPEYLDKYI